MLDIASMTRSYCYICQRPQKTCLCSFIKRINNVNEVFIFQHPSEKKHPLGTAKILSLSLQKSHIFIGETFEEEELLQVLPHPINNTYLLFPGDHSNELSSVPQENNEVFNLIVLDGTWRKCKLLLHKNPFLKRFPSIHINPEKPSKYTIRKSPLKEGLSTVEAVTEVLSFWERNPAKFSPLLQVFEKMIKNQIKKIPSEIFEKNYKKKG